MKNLLLGLKTGLFSIGDGGFLGLHSSVHSSLVFLRAHNKIYFWSCISPDSYLYILVCSIWWYRNPYGNVQSLGIADEIAKWYRDWIICCYFTSTILYIFNDYRVNFSSHFSLLLPIQQHLLFPCKRVTEVYHRKIV